jgi:hypothetical protein
MSTWTNYTMEWLQLSMRFLKADKKTVDLVGNEKMKASASVRHLALPCNRAARQRVIPDIIRCYSQYVLPSNILHAPSTITQFSPVCIMIFKLLFQWRADHYFHRDKRFCIRAVWLDSWIPCLAWRYCASSTWSKWFCFDHYVLTVFMTHVLEVKQCPVLCANKLLNY